MLGILIRVTRVSIHDIHKHTPTYQHAYPSPAAAPSPAPVSPYLAQRGAKQAAALVSRYGQLYYIVLC